MAGSSNKSIIENAGVLITTIVFGATHLISVLSKVALNKVAAITMGADGMGVLGLYQSLHDVLKSFFGFGYSESIVRDISIRKSDPKSNFEYLSYSLRIILALSFIGFLISFCIFLFLPFVDEVLISLILSLSIFVALIGNWLLGVMKGLRETRLIAKSVAISALTSSAISAALYYLYAIEAVAFVIFITSLISLLVTAYYSKGKIAILSFERKQNSDPTHRNALLMGGSLMYVSFLVLLSDFIVKAYISTFGSISDAGLYQVGLMVVSGYFGILIKALSSDYYPRISGIHDDNEAIKLAMNNQSLVGLVLILPFFSLIIVTLDYTIAILFSKEFLIANKFIEFALMGSLITICSNAMGMILLAKRNSKVFMVSVTSLRLLSVLLFIFLYSIYGMIGLGYAFLINSVVHFVAMQLIMGKLYNIFFSKAVYFTLVSVLLLGGLSMITNRFVNDELKLYFLISIFLASIAICFYLLRAVLGVNLTSISNKLRGRFD